MMEQTDEREVKRDMSVTKGIQIALLAVMLLMLLMPSVALAASYTDQGLGENSHDPLTGVTVNRDEAVNGGVPTVNLPNVQIEQAKDFAERKGFDIVNLLQVFGQPFAIILFIFGAFVAGIGALAKSSAMAKGFIVMGIAVLVYAAVLSAPELLDFGNAWLKS